jgi:hypothetical protein
VEEDLTLFEFKDIPERPPRSVALLPGLKYTSILDKSTLFPIIFIILLVAILPIMMVLTLERDFRSPFVEMARAEGSVRGVIDNSKCDRQSVAIQYQFITNDHRTYYGKYVTCRDTLYASLKSGDSVPIVYDPKDPSYNGIEGELGKNDPPILIFFIFPLFFLLIFAPMLAPNIKQIKNARTIFKKGIITRGKIVFIGQKKPASSFNFKGFTNMEVFYSFNTLDGKTIEAKVSTDNRWLANKLELGSIITVSYMERRPKKSIILDFYYR